MVHEKRHAGAATEPSSRIFRWHMPKRAVGSILYVQDEMDASVHRHVPRMVGLLNEAALAVAVVRRSPQRPSPASGPSVPFDAFVELALGELQLHPQLSRLPVGLLATGHDGQCALRVARRWRDRILALALYGLRPAPPAALLAGIVQPTLLIVAGQDSVALRIARSALHSLNGQRRLEVVPGVLRELDQPEAVDTVGQLAGSWLAQQLTVSRTLH